MTTPKEAFSSAAAFAVDCSDKLFDTAQTLIDRPGADERDIKLAVEKIEESAREFRRHAFWLRGEGDLG